MSKETRNQVRGGELRNALEGVLGQRVKSLRRRFLAYSSSNTVEALDVTTARGKKLRLVLKDTSPLAVLTTAQQVRPRFLYHPAREINVYQKILNPARLGTARCIGAVNSPDSERYWLFLERVDGLLLKHVGDLAQWAAAAHWLAELHSRFSNKKWMATENFLRYDEEFFGIWIRRAEKFFKPGQSAESERFAQLAKLYERVAKRLAGLPQTFIHGEAFASNIIVRKGKVSQPICAIDWERAGIGPAPLDLAMLTAGGWSDNDKLRFVTVYRNALASRRAPSVAELLEAVELCHLHVSMQMLGWAEVWAPPKDHAQNWLRTALRLADKLGFK